MYKAKLVTASALGLWLGAAGCASTTATSGSESAPASAQALATAELPVLTAEEKAAGWELLFDGQTTKGWRNWNKTSFPERGWKVVGGILKHEKNEEGFRAGDIITDAQFDNFELRLDFLLTPKTNSGIKYLVTESTTGQTPSQAKSAISFEYQILDDDLHPDAKKGKNGNRTQGSLYDLIPAAADKPVHPIGQWNEARLVVDGNNVEHWLNGKKVVSYVRGSAELKALIAESKFKDVPGFGEASKGHILLQDHNDEIAFKNIKIRRLPARTASR